MVRKKTIDPETYTPTRQGLEILQTICDYGGMTRLQLSILLNYTLTYNKERRLVVEPYCRELIQDLSEAGYLDTVKRPFVNTQGKNAFFHKLTSKGKKAVADKRGCRVSQLRCSPVDSNLEHFVLVNDFRVILLRSISDTLPGAELHATFDGRTLSQMHSKDKMTIEMPALPPRWREKHYEHNVSIIPDFYFHLVDPNHRPNHSRRFVEMDRGTETIKSSRDYDDWAKKIVKYQHYWKEGSDGKSLFGELYGYHAVAVLSVTMSEKRMHNLKEATERVGGNHRFWFTTYDRLTPTNFFTEPIWVVASKPGWYSYFDNPLEKKE